MSEFLKAVKVRRTNYAIGKEKVVPEEKVEQIVKDAVLYSPSAFNSQSARVLLLFGAASDRLWEITKSVLKGVVPPDAYPKTEAKLNAFEAGYGTVLYFEDQDTVKKLQEQFPLYKDNFPRWSEQSSGMLQYVVWTALSDAGLGANLQHYNPLIDEKVKAEWQVPASWRLIGEMPFGKPMAPVDAKAFGPVERMKVYR